jgi:hypothetical protein
MQRSRSVLFLALGLSGACAVPEPSASSESEAYIHDGGSLANSYFRARAVKMANKCTGTRIAPRFLITASHCYPRENHVPHLYSTGPGFDSALGVRVERVHVPPGLSMASCATEDGDCEDGNGNFADMVVVELSAEAANDYALTGPQATLAWHFPDEGKWGTKVGAGDHGGNSNPDGRLLQASDTVDTDDSGGYFETENDQTNKGDSGGPFYSNQYGDQQIIGVLWGHNTDDYDIYTSVPFRLEWILDKINFKWSGAQRQTDTMLSGTTIDIVAGSEQKVQYACEKTPACEGYMYNAAGNGMGWLVDNITGTSNGAGFSSALKYGARSANSGFEVGYVRSDGYNAVVKLVSGTVVELYKKTGAWQGGTISGSAPRAAGVLSAYKRADGINAVVFRSSTNRIIELALVGGQWMPYDLTNTPGAAAPSGDPVAFVGADGTSAIVYRSGTQIHELRLGSRGWMATNVSAAAGTSVAAAGNLHAFVRSDGYSSIVYRSGTGIYELYRAPGGTWASGGISNLASAPPAASRPFGYTHKNGTNAIVYRDTTNRLVEMWLDSSGWRAGRIPGAVPSGDPVAYVRTDGVESIVFRDGTKIMEATNTPWQTWNLSNMGVPPAWGDPSVFIRTDGYNSILTHDNTSDVLQLYYKRGSAWGWNDLSEAVGI